MHVAGKWHLPGVMDCLQVNLHPLFLSEMLASRAMDQARLMATAHVPGASLQGPRQKSRRGAQQAPVRLQVLHMLILGCCVQRGKSVHSPSAPEMKECMCCPCGV